MASVLGKDPEKILALLKKRRTARFVWLGRRLTDETAEKIRKLKLPGVGIIGEWRRHYPNGSLAAHVVGFVSKDKYARECGLEGMELYAERYLAATDGQKIVLADAGRRAIYDAADTFVAPKDGRSVVLTIDVVIQRHLEKAVSTVHQDYEAESAVGIVMDPRTGDILAVATSPGYDLNAFGQATTEERRPRAFTDPYEPGSIFKPFVAVAALACGKVRWGEEIYCHGGVYRCRSGRRLRDAHGYGKLAFEEVVYKSSNIGMAVLGERLGNRALYDIVTAFGFGKPAGVELGGESPGLVNEFGKWNSYTTTSIPMGQEIGVTPIQMAAAFSVFANGGILLKPKLIRAVYGPDGKMVNNNAAPHVVRRVIEKDLCRRFVKDVLAKVPSPIGTARRSPLDGWTSFGKTGTAQISPYGAGQFTGSYIAGAPVGNPRLVCLVSVRKPNKSKGYYGGVVAAPAVKEVLEKSLAYLEVPKDKLD